MFHVIPESHAVTRIGGVYRQSPVYKHNERLFIKHGSGYVFIMSNGDTSVPKLSIDELVLPFTKRANNLGYMVTPEFEGKSRECK